MLGGVVMQPLAAEADLRMAESQPPKSDDAPPRHGLEPRPLVHVPGLGMVEVVAPDAALAHVPPLALASPAASGFAASAAPSATSPEALTPLPDAAVLPAPAPRSSAPSPGPVLVRGDTAGSLGEKGAEGFPEAVGPVNAEADTEGSRRQLLPWPPEKWSRLASALVTMLNARTVGISPARITSPGSEVANDGDVEHGPGLGNAPAHVSLAAVGGVPQHSLEDYGANGGLAVTSMDDACVTQGAAGRLGALGRDVSAASPGLAGRSPVGPVERGRVAADLRLAQRPRLRSSPAGSISPQPSRSQSALGIPTRAHSLEEISGQGHEDAAAA
jgi:hypothetical protein